ncbi:metallophosphoesterase domain-containing protein 1-like [Dreissena polymorpha]|uniref:Calcineurin-like phosphoesterase domain-containing protein n=1 Tax=Dreissena polymorpha TaxID=45954 RepID=A0A9D4N7Z1_DREPO|nr:metallophosphoesterase domain-containing protein 1-like [Dreissena polymorpha]KAH3889701.1 hypothetical protein DPMN_013763 [Dreissena polymorpha]
MNLDFTVHKVGAVGAENANCVRIVHISDTHMRHAVYKKDLPPGDILIHSGDFCQYSIEAMFTRKSTLMREYVSEVNSFFSDLPYSHKILVAGNHEMCATKSDKALLEASLSSVTYLQDKSVTIEGLNIYGTPWTKNRWYSYADSFTKRQHGSLRKVWDNIPESTDVLVTHMPPFGILDLALKKFSLVRSMFSQSEELCSCGEQHPTRDHWGCHSLRTAVLDRIRPLVHLFGHTHECNAIVNVNGVTFSNAAMKLNPTINVIDVYKSRTIDVEGQ